MDAALAEFEKSEGRKIHPRIFHVYGRRMRRVSLALQPTRGIWLGIQAKRQALLSDAGGGANPSAIFAEPDKLRGYRSRQERYFWNSATAISLPLGRKRAADVGALEAGDD